MVKQFGVRSDNLYEVPPNLPVPVDDGAALHLTGRSIPSILLPSTDGSSVMLNEARSLTVLFCYPRTGRPDRDAPGGLDSWNAIPGARGCTPQSCAYRDHYQEIRDLGATLYGVSTQTTEYQREAASRLNLPFCLLSEASGQFSSALDLPTFQVDHERLLKRITLIINRGRIVHCLYPVFPPDKDAEHVIDWLRTNTATLRKP